MVRNLLKESAVNTPDVHVFDPDPSVAHRYRSLLRECTVRAHKGLPRGRSYHQRLRDTFDIADWLLITRVQLEPEDTRFPCLDQSAWEEISRTEHPKGKDDDAAFTAPLHARRRS
jgi:hypothetical protein